jgi:elongation factor Ts
MMRSSVLRGLGARSISRWTVLPRPISALGGESFSSWRLASTVDSARFPPPVLVGIRSFADFSMAQLKELRAISGAPIVDCKKALGETSGNVDEAMDWLRQHGAAKAAQKVSGRDAEEGLVACMVSADGKSAAIVKVSSETDFAGKSQAFVDFVHHVATATIGSNETGSLDSEHVLALQSSSKSVKTALEEAIVAIRENLGIASAIKWTSDNGMLVSYVHGKVSEGSAAGSSAAIVELVGSASVSPEVIREAGRKVAMHIVASKPTYLNVEDIPEEILAKERAILQSQVRL